MDAVAALIAFRAVWAIFVHSNVRLPTGPLRFFLGAPELHHWHHAKLARTHHNFANLAPWLDVLFGTYHRPDPDKDEDYPIGVPDPLPRGYLAQLAHPFLVSLRRGPALFSSTPAQRHVPKDSHS